MLGAPSEELGMVCGDRRERAFTTIDLSATPEPTELDAGDAGSPCGSLVTFRSSAVNVTAEAFRSVVENAPRYFSVASAATSRYWQRNAAFGGLDQKRDRFKEICVAGEQLGLWTAHRWGWSTQTMYVRADPTSLPACLQDIGANINRVNMAYARLELTHPGLVDMVKEFDKARAGEGGQVDGEMPADGEKAPQAAANTLSVTLAKLGEKRKLTVASTRVARPRTADPPSSHLSMETPVAFFDGLDRGGVEGLLSAHAVREAPSVALLSFSLRRVTAGSRVEFHADGAVTSASGAGQYQVSLVLTPAATPGTQAWSLRGARDGTRRLCQCPSRVHCKHVACLLLAACAREDPLGDALAGVPAEVHARAVELASAGGIMRTTPAQRRRNQQPRTRGSLPPEFYELYRHGYVSPNYAYPPADMRWALHGGETHLLVNMRGG